MQSILQLRTAAVLWMDWCEEQPAFPPKRNHTNISPAIKHASSKQPCSLHIVLIGQHSQGVGPQIDTRRRAQNGTRIPCDCFFAKTPSRSGCSTGQLAPWSTLQQGERSGVGPQQAVCLRRSVSAMESNRRSRLFRRAVGLLSWIKC